ncbi:hypothetical protein [Aliiroseovarius sp. S253]|uniref:hypothetical protein n=1 Tax=Aliiroseovarius sp. S253 TaxID=3415133 RepID=UPI003C7EB358
MTAFEIVINVCVLPITVAVLLYLRHLVRVSGSDPVDDPERVIRFRETAPYHLLERGN